MELSESVNEEETDVTVVETNEFMANIFIYIHIYTGTNRRRNREEKNRMEQQRQMAQL